MSENLRKQLKGTLSKVSSMPNLNERKKRLAQLAHDPLFVNSIIEVCKNVVKRRVEFSPDCKRKLARKKHLIRCCSRRKPKRKDIVQSATFIPHLIPIVKAQLKQYGRTRSPGDSASTSL